MSKPEQVAQDGEGRLTAEPESNIARPSPSVRRFETVAMRSALYSLMRFAVMSASSVSPPNAAFRCSTMRRSAASDRLRAFAARQRSMAWANVMLAAGFGGSICSSALASSASALSWVHSAL